MMMKMMKMMKKNEYIRFIGNEFKFIIIINNNYL